MRIGMVINVNISTKLPFVNHNVKTSTRLGHPLWAGLSAVSSTEGCRCTP